jgi:hypothetical protein
MLRTTQFRNGWMNLFRLLALNLEELSLQLIVFEEGGHNIALCLHKLEDGGVCQQFVGGVVGQKVNM